VRRKTFLSADEIDGNVLRSFKIVKGPAQVVRFDRTSDDRSPHAVTLMLRDPNDGRLAADWDGKIRLLVTVPTGSAPDPSAIAALVRIGLWPLDKTITPRAELLVGNVLVVFTRRGTASSITTAILHKMAPKALSASCLSFGSMDRAAMRHGRLLHRLSVTRRRTRQHASRFAARRGWPPTHQTPPCQATAVPSSCRPPP
jgi:hypothetical protein